MKKYITPIIYRHRSSRRYNAKTLLGALEKLDQQELESLAALLLDKEDEISRTKRSLLRGQF
jgi:formate dehydrogenase maturation protein FdhE